MGEVCRVGGGGGGVVLTVCTLVDLFRKILMSKDYQYRRLGRLKVHVIGYELIWETLQKKIIFE